MYLFFLQNPSVLRYMRYLDNEICNMKEICSQIMRNCRLVPDAYEQMYLVYMCHVCNSLPLPPSPFFKKCFLLCRLKRISTQEDIYTP